MFSTEVDSWFSILGNRTCCDVNTDCGINYFFVFIAEHGVAGIAKAEEWKLSNINRLGVVNVK